MSIRFIKNGNKGNVEDTIPYTQIEYIQSSGLEHIDTGVSIKSTLCIKMLFEAIDSGNQFQSIMGGDGGSSRSYYGLAFDISSNNKLSFNYFTSTTATASITRFNKKLKLETHYQVANLMSIDEASAQALVGSKKELSYDDVNIFLFASSRDGNAICNSNIKLYNCQIYDNLELIRDFVPVKDNNGVYCLYDKITRELYYNQGTGAFTGE